MKFGLAVGVTLDFKVPMPKNSNILKAEHHDDELEALCAITLILKRLHFDQQWRVVNYIIVRLWGRTWTLAKPKSDSQ